MSDIYDELGDETSGLTRRQVIKRVGIGAAVAWAAPAITTLGARAYAASPRCASPCADVFCIGAEQCGSSGPFGICLCTDDVDGNCGCWEDPGCGSTPACTSNAQCAGDTRCVVVCCSRAGQCLPPCGTDTTSVQGTAPASRA